MLAKKMQGNTETSSIDINAVNIVKDIIVNLVNKRFDDMLKLVTTIGDENKLAIAKTMARFDTLHQTLSISGIRETTNQKPIKQALNNTNEVSSICNRITFDLVTFEKNYDGNIHESLVEYIEKAIKSIPKDFNAFQTSFENICKQDNVLRNIVPGIRKANFWSAMDKSLHISKGASTPSKVQDKTDIVSLSELLTPFGVSMVTIDNVLKKTKTMLEEDDFKNGILIKETFDIVSSQLGIPLDKVTMTIYDKVKLYLSKVLA